MRDSAAFQACHTCNSYTNSSQIEMWSRLNFGKDCIFVACKCLLARSVGQGSGLKSNRNRASVSNLVSFYEDETRSYGEIGAVSPYSVLAYRTVFRHDFEMKRAILFYAALLAGLIFVLEWLEFQYMARVFSTEIYIILIGLGFPALGLWLGRVLTPQATPNPFSLNEAALNSLGITKREYADLEQLAGGQSNKEIAETLHVSPNTVKTHVARLYDKLEVSQRVQAVQKAKELHLIP